MQELEVRFLEQYKRLDVLCNDIFSCRNGVSEYITQMEQVPLPKRRYVTSWEGDFRTLKHLRWLRNKITHETVISDCEAEDIEDVVAFYNRILNGQDPLAILYKMDQQRLLPKNSNTTEPQWSAIDRRLSAILQQWSRRKDCGKWPNVPNSGKGELESAVGKLPFIAISISVVFLIIFIIRMSN